MRPRTLRAACLAVLTSWATLARAQDGGVAPASASPVDRATPVTPEDGWRLHRAIGSPRWLRFGLEQRTRFEHLGDDFRSAAKADGNTLVARTLLSGELLFTHLQAGLELEDARALSTEGTLLNTTIVNPVELLRAWVGVSFKDVLAPGDELKAQVGRLTLDVGSRRLLARNEFRNTINAFTGVDAQYQLATRHTVRVLAVVPVTRAPSDTEGLAVNRVVFDVETFDTLLWSAFFTSAPSPDGLRFEGYVFGLHERDTEKLPTANRNLFTPGFRVWVPPAAGKLDVQLEVMGQVGTSRASTAATDTADLEHAAASVHLSAGYRFKVWGAPRVLLAWDLASGDRDPRDGSNQRFDPLFAARRFEWGPTSLYGALGRTNTQSPMLRVELAPHRNVDAFVSYRAVWLASPTDAWVAAGLRDRDGSSGSFVGQQLEGRVRWQVFPKNLALEVGAATLIPGDFALATQTREWSLPLYLYGQFTLWL